MRGRPGCDAGISFLTLCLGLAHYVQDFQICADYQCNRTFRPTSYLQRTNRSVVGESSVCTVTRWITSRWRRGMFENHDVFTQPLSPTPGSAPAAYSVTVFDALRGVKYVVNL